ncbi:MAG: hypothetical protein IJ361_09620 [Spirochaetaceae bacterium]|nr:hypothetical protein [Spirochaetaceae bacterium]
MLEYAFIVECDGVESDESGKLDVMGWIKTQLKDKKTGIILSNTKYTIYLLDGTEKKEFQIMMELCTWII